jgi:hypothetical protein
VSARDLVEQIAKAHLPPERRHELEELARLPLAELEARVFRLDSTLAPAAMLLGVALREEAATESMSPAERRAHLRDLREVGSEGESIEEVELDDDSSEADPASVAATNRWLEAQERATELRSKAASTRDPAERARLRGEAEQLVRPARPRPEPLEPLSNLDGED